MLEEAAKCTGVERFEVYPEKTLADRIAEQEIPKDATECVKILMRWLHKTKGVTQDGKV